MSTKHIQEIFKPFEHKDAWDYTISTFDGNAKELTDYLIKELDKKGYGIYNKNHVVAYALAAQKEKDEKK